MFQTVSLLGSASGRNAGDAALISGIMDSVDAACGRQLLYEIPTINTKFIRQTYTKNRVKPIPMMPWNLAVKMFGLPTYRSAVNADISLVFDAVLFDRSLYNPLFNFLSSLYLILPQAKKRGKKVGLFNVGAGPVSTPQGRKMLRELANTVDFVVPRDKGSYDLLLEIGVTNPNMFMGADAALNSPASDPARCKNILTYAGVNPEKEIFAVNVNAYLDTWASPNRKSIGKEPFVKAYVGALNRVARDLGVQLLFVATQHHDVDITREVMDGVISGQPKGFLSNTSFDHFDIKGALGQVSLLFAMRLHAMILASSMHTPIIGLAYQPKCQYYYDSLSISRYCMSFDDFSEEALYRHMIEGWQSRGQLRSILDNNIPVMKHDANKAAHVVARMSEGCSAAEAIKLVQGDESHALSGAA